MITIVAVVIYSIFGVRPTARATGNFKRLEYGIIPKFLVLLSLILLIIVFFVALAHNTDNFIEGPVFLSLIFANSAFAYQIHFSKILFNDDVMEISSRFGKTKSIPWSNVTRRVSLPFLVFGGPYLVTKDYGRVWYSSGQHGYEEFDSMAISKLSDR